MTASFISPLNCYSSISHLIVKIRLQFVPFHLRALSHTKVSIINVLTSTLYKDYQYVFGEDVSVIDKCVIAIFLLPAVRQR